MKASLLAISISSVLVAPAFATAPQVNVELANQQTLQLIDGQMKAVDASVQYKLNEQYANATPGTTATIDDVTYEKQSNGTWAAVGAASAALVAGLLSSSASSSSNDEATPTIPVLPDNDLPTTPGIVNPIEPVIENPIEDDTTTDMPEHDERTVSVEPNGMIIVDGEKTDYNVNKDGIISKDGQTIAHAQETTQGYVVTGVDGAKIIIDENGNIKSIDMPTEPIMPEHDERTVSVEPNGMIIVDGEKTDYNVNKDGIISKDGQTIAHAQETTQGYVVTGVDGAKIIIDENGNIKSIDMPTEPIMPEHDERTVSVEPNGMIIVDGEKTDYNVNKDGIISKDGQTIAHAQETTQGYVVTGVDGAKIIIDENGNIKSIDMPTEPTMPEHDERTVSVEPNGVIIVDGEKTDYNVNKDGIISKDGQTIAHAQETTQGYVVTGVDGAKIIIDENGNIKSIDMPTEPTMPEHDELKTVQLGNDGSIYVDGEATSLTAEVHDNSVTYTIRNEDGLVIGEANTIPLKDSDISVTVVKINDKTIIINEQGHIIPNEALKPALMKLDSNKFQSIDPTKLQKAKSAIQQRLRG